MLFQILVVTLGPYFYTMFGTCYSILSKNSSPKMSRKFNYFMVITIGMRKVAECDINLDYTIDHLGDGRSLEHILRRVS